MRVQKKLTITVDERIYEGLHRVIGRGNISQFIEDLVRPHVQVADLEEGYRQLALDEEMEHQARVWCESLIGDVEQVLDEAR